MRETTSVRPLIPAILRHCYEAKNAAISCDDHLRGRFEHHAGTFVGWSLSCRCVVELHM